MSALDATSSGSQVARPRSVDLTAISTSDFASCAVGRRYPCSTEERFTDLSSDLGKSR